MKVAQHFNKAKKSYVSLARWLRKMVIKKTSKLQ